MTLGGLPKGWSASSHNSDCAAAACSRAREYGIRSAACQAAAARCPPLSLPGYSSCAHWHAKRPANAAAQTGMPKQQCKQPKPTASHTPQPVPFLPVASLPCKRNKATTEMGEMCMWWSSWARWAGAMAAGGMATGAMPPGLDASPRAARSSVWQESAKGKSTRAQSRSGGESSSTALRQHHLVTPPRQPARRRCYRCAAWRVGATTVATRRAQDGCADKVALGLCLQQAGQAGKTSRQRTSSGESRALSKSSIPFSSTFSTSCTVFCSGTRGIDT